MITLNLVLSSFRLTAQPSTRLPSSCQLQLSTTTRRLSAVESPVLPRPVSSATNPSTTELIVPSTWKVCWTEHLPDRLALQAAKLYIRVVRPQNRSRRVSSLLHCTFNPASRALGSLRLSLIGLSTGTVCHSLGLRASDGTTTNYTLSFDAVVEQPTQLRLTLANITFSLPSTSHHDTPLSPSDQLDQPQNAGQRLVVIDREQNVHLDSSEPASAFLTVEHHPSNSIVTSEPSPLSPVTDDSSSQKSPTHFFRSLPPLVVSASSLFSLARSSLKLALHPSPMQDSPEQPIATVQISLHEIWGALLHPRRTFSHVTPTSQSSPYSVHFDLKSDSGPPLGQQIGGVTTNSVVTGAKPVIFGAPMAHLSRHPREPSAPEGWILLVDTFGYRFFRHISTGKDVWIPPSCPSITEALAADVAAAHAQGLSRVREGLYQRAGSGTHVWIHPSAKCYLASVGSSSDSTDDGLRRASAVQGDSSDSPNTSHDFEDMDRAPEIMSSRATSFSLSTMDAMDHHPGSLMRLVETASTAPSVRDADEVGSQGLEVGRPRIVEFRWTPLPIESSIPGGGCEGHTLTAMCNRRGLLRFGGSVGRGRVRSNALQWFDASSLQWSEIDAQGVVPDGRTGHGAVALGSDASRLLIFGGTSSQGRRNDLHVYHTLNKTWSPVACTGTPPGVRARMGMTATSDGQTALIFGGRSLYRWMGGIYYDPLFIHAFHAERAQWIQMQPRGSGPRPSPRSGCAVEFLNDRLMVVHGGYEDGNQFFDDTFLFDLTSSSWVLPPYPNEDTKPTAREGHASTVLDGNVMMICGGDGESVFSSDVHLFEGDKLRWIDKPNLVGMNPGHTVSGAMATIDDGRVIFAGGEGSYRLSRMVYRLDVSHRSVVAEEGFCELIRERGPDASTCVVCLDQPVETMFLWCGHSVCCTLCSRMVRRVCPVCRKTFSKVVYNSFREM